MIEVIFDSNFFKQLKPPESHWMLSAAGLIAYKLLPKNPGMNIEFIDNSRLIA